MDEVKTLLYHVRFKNYLALHQITAKFHMQRNSLLTETTITPRLLLLQQCYNYDRNQQNFIYKKNLKSLKSDL